MWGRVAMGPVPDQACGSSAIRVTERAAFEEAARGTFTPEVQDGLATVLCNGGRRERRTCTVLGGTGLCARVARPVPPDPGTHRTPRPPQATALRAPLHLEPARGRRGAAGTGPRPLAGAFWARERPSPHPGCAVPGGRLPPAHGPRACRDGHPRMGRPEHGAHGTAESRYECVHRAAEGPDWTPLLDFGHRPCPNRDFVFTLGVVQRRGGAPDRNRTW